MAAFSQNFSYSNTATSTYRHDGFFADNPQIDSNQLSEDLLFLASLTYLMMKRSLLGFAVLGIPFWVGTVGILSML